ncbi:hypothetical protein M8009_00790 [Halomonas sp. ATCH28]|uniref:Uncharacterized protein n=1 Tax=Halomonas gemina TaxID=2945105 RepID=A0ABT0SW00_9GAMM|nr:hypothetical protein [Halomonas gemina]MCL7938839.1 hypothetical protein [Halomonas gemina]
MAKDLPLWRPLLEYEPGAVDLDFSATGVEPYVAPYEAPSAGSVDLDFWGDYSPGEPLDLRLDFAPTTYRYQPPGAGAVDLDFSGDYTAPEAGAADLAFGGEAGGTPEAATPLTINATLPSLAAYVRLEASNTLRVQATLPKTVAVVALSTDINVHRDPSHLAASGYQRAATLAAVTGDGYRQSKQRRQQTATRYQHADPARLATSAPARQLSRLDALRRGVQQQAAPLSHTAAWRYQLLPPLDRFRRVREQQGVSAWAVQGVLGRFLPHLRTGWGLAYQETERILARHWGSDWQFGEFRPLDVHGPYEQAIDPPPGVSVPPRPPEPPEEPGWPELPAFFRGSSDLNFCQRLPVGTALDVGVDPCDPDAPIVAPIQRTYLVSNSASLTLVATGQALEASAISVAIDADSWAWELRATLLGEASLKAVRDAVQPVEVEAEINGHTWRGVLDGWSRDRQWGSLPTATLSARSLAAYLGAPHAQPRSYAETQTRTAQQLAEQELPLGWTLDWQIDDWLIEPEAWHYTNRTPIEAITAIATAAGAVVQAHPSEPRLIIAPRYAAPHWAWAGETPDVTLPLDLLTRLGSEYRPSEPLNGVYVSGETTGVLALVKRTGTAADRQGEMIVDPLITRQAPARGRGIAVLSASGEQTRESLALPVATDIAGLLATGQLVRIDPDGNDWRGLVRAVSVSARLNNDALVVEQTAELERHLEETA